MNEKVIKVPSEEVFNYLDSVKSEVTKDVIVSEQFVNAYPTLCNTISLLSDIKKDLDNSIKSIAREEYLKSGSTHIDTDGYKVTFVAGTVSRKFNTSKFKKDHPDLYEEYMEDSLSSDYVKIKIKGE